MDWDGVIERNREALKRVLAALVAMAGLGDRQSAIGSRQSELLTPTADCQLPIAATLPRHLHRAVLRLLRPAEAATRRLVIVAARGMVVTAPPVRLRGKGYTEPFNPPPPRIRSAPPPASRVADGRRAVERPSSPPGTGGRGAERMRGGEGGGEVEPRRCGQARVAPPALPASLRPVAPSGPPPAAGRFLRAAHILLRRQEAVPDPARAHAA